ncbi:MAG: M48 family metallopeptidase [Patescibacteria group bacterium]
MLFTVFFGVVIAIGWVFAQAYNDSSILVIAVLFSVGMSFTSYWFSDKIVLGMAHAKQVDLKSAPELYRIVENLCITAGLPMPRIYIIPEEALNAFATGRNPEHAVIAVTAGLLKTLTKPELEGVIAHELSHIGNRDMLVSTMAVVLVGFISLVSDMFLRSMMFGRRRSSDNDGGGGGAIILIAVLLSVLAPISAMLIQLAISRKREFLADASGALLTRYPEGLASALQKIGHDVKPMSVAKNTTSHLWIDDPFTGDSRKAWFHKLFMTHPPITDRIKALRGIKS